MKDKLIKQICCSRCKYEFANVVERDGKQVLVVCPPELQLKVLSRNPDVFVAVCPKCKYETVVDMDLIRRY